MSCGETSSKGLSTDGYRIVAACLRAGRSVCSTTFQKYLDGLATASWPRAGAWGSDFRQRLSKQSPERQRQVHHKVVELSKRNSSLHTAKLPRYDLAHGMVNDR